VVEPPIPSLFIASGHLDLPEIGIATTGGTPLREHVKAMCPAFHDELLATIAAIDKHRRIVVRQFNEGVSLAMGTLSGFGGRHDSPPFVFEGRGFGLKAAPLMVACHDKSSLWTALISLSIRY
jgi:hypothetical protein